MALPGTGIRLSFSVTLWEERVGGQMEIHVAMRGIGADLSCGHLDAADGCHVDGRAAAHQFLVHRFRHSSYDGRGPLPLSVHLSVCLVHRFRH